ncbi:Transcription factor spt8 [Escovopsis weberi]|uniref:Transcription factor spt8 n=1 Tax=Escovopsis weberi TaxID=150374 RepID=A0A0M9VTH1_ESCWE|nr:Transcription factor spt8 [Escovopsis weberi]
MAAPMSTSINAMAITPDLRYWLTGGSDGYIRKYDGPNTINGRLALTVAQRHPFVDSVTKAGILMSYWENEEPPPPGRGAADQDQTLSPVYSLAVHSDALWLLSGLESGAINLQSVRHDEGKRICSLQKHTNAVSVLTIAPDEKSVLSGAWDKNIFDWDLNTGGVIRSFGGSGGQISAIELRPAGGMPVPAHANDPPPSRTISTNNGAPMTNGGGGGFAGFVKEGSGGGSGSGGGGSGGYDGTTSFATKDGQASPAHESLFGDSDAGSLFGETAGDQPFGNDDDEYGAGMDMMADHRDGAIDHSADMTMADIDGMDVSSKDAASGPQPGGDYMDVDTSAAGPFPARDQGHSHASQGSDHGAGADAQSASTHDPSQATQSMLDSQSGPSAQEHQQPWSFTSAADHAGGPSSPQDQQQQQQPQDRQRQDSDHAANPAQSPLVFNSLPPPSQHDPMSTSASTFLSSAIDGTIRIWDRRAPNPVATINNRIGVPPWCMSACWSPDGNRIYAGRRNGTVEEFDIARARRAWEPERVLKFPAGSGAVSAVRPMVNGRHLVCASHDILRLYDLQDASAFKHSTVPFLIIPGPPRAGVISSLYIDPTSRFMLSAAGTRGWDGTCTEVLIGYEIQVVSH